MYSADLKFLLWIKIMLQDSIVPCSLYSHRERLTKAFTQLTRSRENSNNEQRHRRLTTSFIQKTRLVRLAIELLTDLLNSRLWTVHPCNRFPV